MEYQYCMQECDYMCDFTLYQGDCLEKMKNIPDKSIDMVLCDLPYGVTQNKWDSVIPPKLLWAQYDRIVKADGAVCLFSQMPFTAKLVTSNDKNFKYIWTWYKHYARNFLNAKKQPLRTTEHICVFYEKQCTYNPHMRIGKLRKKGNSSKQRGCYGNYKVTNAFNNKYYPTDILDFTGVPVNELKHPTQKPVPLLEYLITTYTNEDEIVLDNCMGSGSTGVACANTGRKFIGIELKKEYFDISRERIEKAFHDNNVV